MIAFSIAGPGGFNASVVSSSVAERSADRLRRAATDRRQAGLAAINRSNSSMPLSGIIAGPGGFNASIVSSSVAERSADRLRRAATDRRQARLAAINRSNSSMPLSGMSPLDRIRRFPELTGERRFFGTACVCIDSGGCQAGMAHPPLFDNERHFALRASHPKTRDDRPSQPRKDERDADNPSNGIQSGVVKSSTANPVSEPEFQ